MADVRRAVMAAAMAGAAAGVLVAQQPTFRAGVDLVNLGVTVTDRRGAFLGDLTASDFEVYEDGQKQTITYFIRGDATDAQPELHIGLLLDTSGSMSGDIALARSAAIRFLNTLTDARDMTLVDFDTEVRVARYGQADFPRVVERIRGRTPSGWTAMYDALGVYLDESSSDEGRTILVIYTDGGDTRSTLRFDQLMSLVRASDVTIHTVGFLERGSSASELLARARLIEIAEATGGQAFFPTSMRDIQAAYDRVVAQIRGQYSLGYQSTNPRRDGRWRKVEIRVTRPDLRGARVQSREGYFALLRP